MLIIIIGTATNVYASDVRGIIKDETGNSVAGVRISIDGSDYVTSANDGTFSLVTPKKIEMPVKVSISKFGYELKEVTYKEDENYIEIIISKLKDPNQGKVNQVLLRSKENIAFKNIIVLIDGNTYLANREGKVNINKWANYNSEIIIPGYDILGKTYKKDEKSIIVDIKISSIEDEILASINDTSDYKSDFDKIFKQFEYEKKLLTESNRKIELEITYVINKLKADSTLTPQQREELKQYLSELEAAYESNKATIQNVVEKKYNLIFKLKMIIEQKDSIYLVSQQKLLEYQKQKEMLEVEYKRKLKFYGAIIFLLAVIVVAGAILLRIIYNQKKIIEEQNQKMDAFVYKASHEIKGPLHSMIGLTDLAKKDIKDNTALSYIEMIAKSAQKQLMTVNDLLHLSRVKQMPLNLKLINPVQLIQEVIQSLSFKDGFSRLKINIKCDENMQFHSDEKILYSVIQNLIENSIKYQDTSKQDSLLNIEVKKINHSILLEFTDNGLGIDKIHHKKLFDMFYKANEHSEGSGLGLYIVKLSVERLGGTIEVNSEHNLFTKFSISLPTRY
ncbi:MAG: ATP-binding protein [Cytophagaceae bacterium]|nr:ATP-binding protein [Cytophagaceae bacterium]MDW8455638.1 ATP-binding protein [Cytophagaceae bacterium]